MRTALSSDSNQNQKTHPMANGNIFLLVPAANFQQPLPADLTCFDWTEYQYDAEDPQAPPTPINVHPTWEQLAQHNVYEFGPAVPVQHQGATVYVVELLASWLTGDVAKIQATGFNLLEVREARQFIADNQPEPVAPEAPAEL